ncbi:MAG TPA: SPOR domain-containing protein, partial [Thermomonas sp.]|nr:SPOR domain-containing protein [Thermomonas sp.]
PASAPGEACLSFGPFADAAARDALRPALASALQLVAREQPAKPTRGWRVMLPAQPTREAAVALAERIKAAGINDLYVMGEGPEANSIALGRFGAEEAARRREAELRAKGFPAQASPLGGSPAQWWLDVRLSANADRAAVAAFGPSRPVACDTLR